MVVELLGRNELVKDYSGKEISERITLYIYIKYYTVILILISMVFMVNLEVYNSLE